MNILGARDANVGGESIPMRWAFVHDMVEYSLNVSPKQRAMFDGGVDDGTRYTWFSAYSVRRGMMIL